MHPQITLPYLNDMSMNATPHHHNCCRSLTPSHQSTRRFQVYIFKWKGITRETQKKEEENKKMKSSSQTHYNNNKNFNFLIT